MRHAYETCLPLLLSQVAWHIRDCENVYDSDINLRLRPFESTIQQNVQFILASVDHSLEDLSRDEAPTDPKHPNASHRCKPLKETSFSSFLCQGQCGIVLSTKLSLPCACLPLAY